MDLLKQKHKQKSSQISNHIYIYRFPNALFTFQVEFATNKQTKKLKVFHRIIPSLMYKNIKQISLE